MSPRDRVLITKMAEAVGPDLDIGDGRLVLIALDNAGFDSEDITHLLDNVIEHLRVKRATASSGPTPCY